MALLIVGSMAGMATVHVMPPIFCTAHFILFNGSHVGQAVVEARSPRPDQDRRL